MRIKANKPVGYYRIVVKQIYWHPMDTSSKYITNIGYNVLYDIFKDHEINIENTIK